MSCRDACRHPWLSSHAAAVDAAVAAAGVEAASESERERALIESVREEREAARVALAEVVGGCRDSGPGDSVATADSEA